MDIYMIILRLVHILAGVFWVGGIVIFAGFVQPAAQAAGADSQKFMQKLFAGPLPLALTIAPPLNVLAGLIMYWRDSAGLSLVWIASGSGRVFTLGALLALAGFVAGFFVARPAQLGLAALGKEIQTSGKPPTAEQLSQMGKYQMTLTQAAIWTAVFVSLALAAMATARYF